MSTTSDSLSSDKDTTKNKGPTRSSGSKKRSSGVTHPTKEKILPVIEKSNEYSSRKRSDDHPIHAGISIVATENRERTKKPRMQHSEKEMMPVDMVWNTQDRQWVPLLRRPTPDSRDRESTDQVSSVEEYDEIGESLSSAGKKQSFSSSDQKITSEGSGDSNNYHETSNWLEPPRDDDLTLFEIHRKPRPCITGSIQLPLKEVKEQFRCVICLGYIHRARIIMECLHRFCEECIEKSLRLGRKECPICRVCIPSRRSLVPDPNFDSLARGILGHEIDRDDSCTKEAQQLIDAQVNLQQAIQKKKLATHETNSNDTNIDSLHRWGSVQSDANDQAPPLIYLHLSRHPKELIADELVLPFLRISGAATVGILDHFLQKKLKLPDTKFRISLDLDGKRTHLHARTTLEFIAEKLGAGKGAEDTINLNYRARKNAS